MTHWLEESQECSQSEREYCGQKIIKPDASISEFAWWARFLSHGPWSHSPTVWAERVWVVGWESRSWWSSRSWSRWRVSMGSRFTYQQGGVVTMAACFSPAVCYQHEGGKAATAATAELIQRCWRSYLWAEQLGCVTLGLGWIIRETKSWGLGFMKRWWLNGLKSTRAAQLIAQLVH